MFGDSTRFHKRPCLYGSSVGTAIPHLLSFVGRMQVPSSMFDRDITCDSHHCFFLFLFLFFFVFFCIYRVIMKTRWFCSRSACSAVVIIVMIIWMSCVSWVANHPSPITCGVGVGVHILKLVWMGEIAYMYVCMYVCMGDFFLKRSLCQLMWLVAGCGIALFFVSAAFEPRLVRLTSILLQTYPLSILWFFYRVMAVSHYCLECHYMTVSLFLLFSQCHVREVVVSILLGELQSMHFF
jgi:hypothetical protein